MSLLGHTGGLCCESCWNWSHNLYSEIIQLFITEISDIASECSQPSRSKRLPGDFPELYLLCWWTECCRWQSLVVIWTTLVVIWWCERVWNWGEGSQDSTSVAENGCLNPRPATYNAVLKWYEKSEKETWTRTWQLSKQSTEIFKMEHRLLKLANLNEISTTLIL